MKRKQQWEGYLGQIERERPGGDGFCTPETRFVMVYPNQHMPISTLASRHGGEERHAGNGGSTTLMA